MKKKKVMHFDKARALIEKGSFKSAELELENAIQIDPNYVDAHILLGDIYLKLKYLKDAYKAYSTATRIEPKNVEAKLKLAFFLVLGKQIDQAQEKLDEVLAAQPENTEALFLMATIQEQEKKTFPEQPSFMKKYWVPIPRISMPISLSPVFAQSRTTSMKPNTFLKKLLL